MRELSNSGKFAMSKAHEIETPTERCRICRCSFKVKLGAASLNLVNLVISRQKIFSNHQNEKMHQEKSLLILVEPRGFEVLEDNELFSDRVCSSCAHKILRARTEFNR